MKLLCNPTDTTMFTEYHDIALLYYAASLFFVEAFSMLESLRWNSTRGQNQGFPQCIPTHCLSKNIATLASASKKLNQKDFLQCSVLYCIV